MAGEKLPGRESRGFYEDFPWLPSWNLVMARPQLADRLELVMAALKPAGEQEPVSPGQLEPVGLADWVEPAKTRAGSSISLTGLGEKVDFGDKGQLVSRRRYRHDDQGRLGQLIEADYNNPQTEPLATTRPTAIRSHSWIYDDNLEVAPLVGARYSEYSQPIEGLVEQTNSTYWFIPSKILPFYEAELIGIRQAAAGEITARRLGGQLIMLSGRVLCPDLKLKRQLKVELSAGEIGAVELIDGLPGSTLEATFDVKRGANGQLVSVSQNPESGLDPDRRPISPAGARAILDETLS